MTFFKIWWIGYTLSVPYLWWYLGWIASHYHKLSHGERLREVVESPVWGLARVVTPFLISVAWPAFLVPSMGTLFIYYTKRLVWRFSK